MLRKTLLVAAVGAAALAVPGMASAATTIDAFTNNLASETESLGTYHLGGTDVLGLSDWDVDVTSKATWTAGLQTHVLWDAAKVRQGQSLAVSRFTPLVNGTMKVSWKVSGNVEVGDLGGGSFATKNLSVEATCLPATLGDGATCTANSPALYLIKTPGLPGSPYVKLVLKTKFQITPEGVITNRTVNFGTGPSAASLPLSQGINAETLKVPCGPVGAGASYRLSNLHYAPKVSATQQPTIQVGLMDPVFGAIETPALVDQGFGPTIKANPAFDLTGTGHTTDLGDVLPNNVKPMIASPSIFQGDAGVPISFYASVASQCDIESYVWKFSNGTTSYGREPQRVFSTPGTYSGQLIVTDESGLKGQRDFTVKVY
ncbi:PKD domain-containing protein [Solirubrobacter phytolaccae]|uniref:PKD domain-containing protein n=1 Tax=Solirubrobacter phytolaccae TaxID=1404360 RepID=A0A9X3NFW7_9ACTN|nr:PKD domain-containing protein [Solirubrobacter phytolaccae]MDA0185356.1 PKD domain-containing protein [Solirubrobacter phytolaccae]